jgi:UDP-N-acetylglucosamine acyltransferase
MIHSTAIIDKEAILGKRIKIGPYSAVEKDAKILDGTEIGHGCVVKAGTNIGKDCKIYEHVSIGNPPQDTKYKGEATQVQIGDRNIIREFVTIHGGTGNATLIGDDNFLMAHVHVAHNCELGNNIVIVNATQVSGYVTIEDYAFISGLCPVHQFVRIGCHSMIAGGYRVPKDVIPYGLAASDPLHIHGLNMVGLRRRGFKREVIAALKKAFDVLLSSDLNTSQALTRIKDNVPLIPEVAHLVDFTEKSERGIAK